VGKLRKRKTSNGQHGRGKSCQLCLKKEPDGSAQDELLTRAAPGKKWRKKKKGLAEY